MKRILSLFLICGVLAHHVHSIFIFAPIIINPRRYPDFGNSYPSDPEPALPSWPTDFIGQELVLHQSSDCSPTKSRFKIPLTGGCQKVPSWMYNDGWEIGATTSSRRIGIRFYADSDCNEFVTEPRANTLRRSRLELNDCSNLDSLNFRVRSFRPIRYY